MERPDPNRNTQVARVMNAYDVDECMATQMLEFASTYWVIGRQEGRAECQRHLRLLLGIEAPNQEESAYWNAPFPLKDENVKG